MAIPKKSLHEVVHESAKKLKELKPGSAHRMQVDKADDDSGYHVETHHGKDDGEYRPPHESVHKSLHSVHKHMKMAFEGEGPKDDDGDDTDSMEDEEDE